MLKDAFALHTQGKFAEAERAYAEILRRQPDHFQALHLMGVLALQRGQIAHSIELLQKSLKREPRRAASRRALSKQARSAARRRRAAS